MNIIILLKLLSAHVITDNIEGVGFLLAAKSIFGFGDLNKAHVFTLQSMSCRALWQVSRLHFL